MILRAFLCLLFVACSAASAQTYPSKPITFVVPYPPGGGYDIIARVIANRLTLRLSQPVVVVNRAGATGTIALGSVAKAAPDGYTLAVGGMGDIAINPYIYRNLPYDVMKDFEWVAILAQSKLMISVHPSVPANSLKELVALAKAQPGKLTYASAGVGVASHIGMSTFAHMTGIEVVHVPFQGAAPASNALVGGHVTMHMSDIMGHAANHRAGRVRTLAIAAPTRAPQLPEIPTFAEAGFEEVDFSTWYGLQAPAGTPQSVVRLLNSEITAIQQQAEVREQLLAVGAEVLPMGPEAVAARARSDYARMAKAVKISGASQDR